MPGALRSEYYLLLRGPNAIGIIAARDYTGTLRGPLKLLAYAALGGPHVVAFTKELSGAP